MPRSFVREALLVVGLCAAAAGCGTNSPVYFPSEMTLVANGQGDTAEAVGTVPLRFRVPNQRERDEMNRLSDQLGQEVPWLREDRVHVEVRYTVKNVSGSEGTFTLRVSGASEFTRYDEAAVAAVFEQAGEDPVILGLMETIPVSLAPGQVYQGIVREDDFREGSLDLDAMGRWMAPFVAVLINRSEVNPVGMDMVPANLVIPAMWEVTVHFAPSVDMECNFLVRVRDDDDRLWQEGQDEFIPEPATFMPMVTMEGV